VAGFIQARDRGGLDSTRCNGKIGRRNGKKTRSSKRDYTNVSITYSSSFDLEDRARILEL
jgi:hypothetical protein